MSVYNGTIRKLRDFYFTKKINNMYLKVIQWQFAQVIKYLILKNKNK
jgi:hypothetical protein